jgi:hypothetical protein
MSILFDPKIFNYVIMSLYLLNAGRWAISWICAFGITATVTWGYAR